MQAAEWDHRLAVRADDKNLIGRSGVVLLRKVVDRVGLAIALSAVLPKGTGPGRRDRGMVLARLVCAIVLGATNVLQAEQLQYHWRPVFPRPVSDSTLAVIDAPVAARVERAAHPRSLIDGPVPAPCISRPVECPPVRSQSAGCS